MSPVQPPGSDPKPSKGPDSKKPTPAKFSQPATPTHPSSILNSPWAKMFEAAGALPTAKQIHQMISTMLRQQLTTMKQDQKRAMETLKKIQREIEGKE